MRIIKYTDGSMELGNVFANVSQGLPCGDDTGDVEPDVRGDCYGEGLSIMTDKLDVISLPHQNVVAIMLGDNAEDFDEFEINEDGVESITNLINGLILTKEIMEDRIIEDNLKRIA